LVKGGCERGSAEAIDGHGGVQHDFGREKSGVMRSESGVRLGVLAAEPVAVFAELMPSDPVEKRTAIEE
jgi:hypothetical protein